MQVYITKYQVIQMVLIRETASNAYEILIFHIRICFQEHKYIFVFHYIYWEGTLLKLNSHLDNGTSVAYILNHYQLFVWF